MREEGDDNDDFAIDKVKMSAREALVVSGKVEVIVKQGTDAKLPRDIQRYVGNIVHSFKQGQRRGRRTFVHSCSRTRAETL